MPSRNGRRRRRPSLPPQAPLIIEKCYAAAYPALTCCTASEVRKSGSSPPIASVNRIVGGALIASQGVTNDEPESDQMSIDAGPFVRVKEMLENERS